MDLIKGKNNGDVYQIAFWGSLASFFIVPTILIVPLVLLISIKNPTYDFNTILSSFLGLSNDNEVVNQFITQSVIIEIIARVLTITLIIGILRKIFIIDAKRFKENWLINSIIIFAGITATLVLTFGLSIIYEILGIEGDPANQEMVEAIINSNMRPFMFVMVVFLAPIFEELIFRKFLIGYLSEKAHLSKIIAIIISATSFALIHVIGDLNGLIFFFQYFALSIVITLSYVFSGYNIYVPIGVHLLNNLISFLLVI